MTATEATDEAALETPPEGRSPWSDRVSRVATLSVRRFSAAWLLLVFVALFSLTAPDTFPTRTTFNLVLSSQVTVGILALAVLIPLTTGTFDLSIGAMLGFSAAITAKLVGDGWSPLSAGLIAILVGTAFGWINGLLVVKLNINSFIATLGSSQLLAAFAFKISDNKQLFPTLPDWFREATTRTALGLSYDTYYLFALAAIVWYVLEYTPVGRALFATGGNAEAARLAGLPTERLIWGSLVASGALSSLGGVLLLSRLGIYTSEIGPGYLFPAFAAVFFGATQIKGRANAWGTLLAMYALAFGVSGLQLTFSGNGFWINPLFQGGALLIAVALTTWSPTRRLFRRSRSSSPAAADSS